MNNSEASKIDILQLAVASKILNSLNLYNSLNLIIWIVQKQTDKQPINEKEKVLKTEFFLCQINANIVLLLSNKKVPGKQI